MKLFPLPGDGRFYCGPAAIASFTGLHPKGEVREAINKVRNRRPTQGVIRMQQSEVAETLKLLGVNVASFTLQNDRLTLQDFAAKYPGFCGIVYVTGHFIAMAGGMCQDNLSGAAYPLSRFSGNRKRVKGFIRVYEVTQ